MQLLSMLCLLAQPNIVSKVLVRVAEQTPANRTEHDWPTILEMVF